MLSSRIFYSGRNLLQFYCNYRTLSVKSVNKNSFLLIGHRNWASDAVKNIQKDEKSIQNDKGHKERIYYGTLTPKIRAVKVFSLATSFGGLASQPILAEQGAKLGGTGMVIALCGFVGFFTFITPVLLHLIVSKYVTEIFYDSKTEEYTANTMSLLLLNSETKFKVSDVKVPEVPGMFTSIIVGKKSLFLDPALFDDTNHYIKIMGYDKPIDFKLNLKEIENLDKKNDLKK